MGKFGCWRHNLYNHPDNDIDVTTTECEEMTAEKEEMTAEKGGKTAENAQIALQPRRRIPRARRRRQQPRCTP